MSKENFMPANQLNLRVKKNICLQMAFNVSQYFVTFDNFVIFLNIEKNVKLKAHFAGSYVKF